MNIFPGFGSTKIPDPPPPPPKDTDPAILAAKEDLRKSELRRKGRAATMLTASEDPLGATSLSRPEARGSKLLGE